MNKPKQVFEQAKRVIAGFNVLINLATTPKPPSIQIPARTQHTQSQWAKNEKTNLLANWRNQARELGYQLREPDSGEYRPREGLPRGHQHTTPHQKNQYTRDSHDQALSRQGTSQRARTSGRQSRSRQGNGR